MSAFDSAYRILLLILCFPAILSAQSKKELEQKKNQLQNEIKATNKQLTETKKNKKISLGQLLTLNKKIDKREQLIETIGSEIGLIGDQINDNQEQINRLEAELHALKKEYAAMIYFAYKNRSNYDKLLFVFASEDFNQAFRRLKYFQQYGDYRKKQAVLIDSTKARIQQHNQQLNNKKEVKNQLLLSEEEEKITLTKEKKEQEKVLTQLQAKEKQLKKELAKKQSDATKLNNAIKKIIDDELNKAREEARSLAKAKRKKEKEEALETAKKEHKAPVIKTPKEEERETEKEVAEAELKLTPEAQLLSKNFAANKARLPWPVNEGIISSTFGEHEHPVLKGIKVKNNGIDISTKKSAASRAVFDGIITGVISIPGAGKAVIIRHGEYLTVYANLASVQVNKGDKVKTKQTLGILLADEDEKSELHFELWRGSVLLNPGQWLYPF